MNSGESQKTYSEKFGDFVRNLRYDEVPGEVNKETKLHILDK